MMRSPYDLASGIFSIAWEDDLESARASGGAMYAVNALYNGGSRQRRFP